MTDGRAEIARTSDSGQLDANHALSDHTRARIIDGFAANTRRAYRSQWLRFERWCMDQNRGPLPATAETLAEYVTHLTVLDRAVSTIEQAIAVVRSAHRNAGHKGQPDTEMARHVVRSYRREQAAEGNRQRKAAPVTIELLRRMVDATPADTLAGKRDRMILVLGLAMMARRSELVALHMDDITEHDEGMTIYIRQSKTDQDAKGAEVAIIYGQHPETCPVRLVRAWRAALAEHGHTRGRLLRSVDRWGNVGDDLVPEAINTIVQDAARRADLRDPERYTAHSLRAGGATAAYKAGAPMTVIAEHGRWNPKSPVVSTYVRAVDQWNNNPLRGIGL